MAQRFAIDAIFRAIDQISNPVARMSAAVSRSTGRMEKRLGRLNKKLAKLSDGGKRMGRGVMVGAAVAGAALAKVVGVGAEFEQTLVNAGSKFAEPIDRGTEAFRDLEKAALAVSGTTEFSAREAAGALEFMAKAGENSAVSMGSLRTFADLASVAQVELSVAADMASDAIGPLGLATDDLDKKSAAYAQTADLMAKTTNMANLGFEELFESIKVGAGAFRGAGQDTTQFLASVATLAGQGIKGSKAGKDLARSISRITDTSTKAPKALKKLGVSFKDGEGNIRDFLDIMTDLRGKLDLKTEAQRAQAISDIFGANSKASGIAILENLEKAREFEDKLAGATGFTAELAAKSRDTALGDIKTFWSTIETLVIGVFGIIRDDVSKVVTSMTAFAKANKAAFSKAVISGLEALKDGFAFLAEHGHRIARLALGLWAVQKALMAFQLVVGTIAAVTAMMTAHAAATGAATVATVGLNLATLALVGSIALLILPWIALGAVIVGTLVFWDEIQIFMMDFFEWIDNTATGIIKNLGEIWDWLGGKIKESTAVQTLIKDWATIEPFFTRLWAAVTAVFDDSLGAIGDAVDTVKNAFHSLMGNDIDVAVRAPNVVNSLGTGARGLAALELVNPGAALDGFESLPGAAANGPGFEPQVVNTTSEEISRSVSESISKSTLDININDPGGVVKSVEQPKKSGGVNVASSGNF